jgi:hypothetical protein
MALILPSTLEVWPPEVVWTGVGMTALGKKAWPPHKKEAWINVVTENVIKWKEWVNGVRQHTRRTTQKTKIEVELEHLEAQNALKLKEEAYSQLMPWWGGKPISIAKPSVKYYYG